MRGLIAFLWLLILIGCSGGESRSVPLPRAYPRIDIPDSAYRSIDSLPVELAVNAGAVCSIRERDGGWWIDISYPGFTKGRFYLSLLYASPQNLHLMVDNRTERMALNLGGAWSEQIDLQSTGGWDCRLLVSSEAHAAPVQMIAVGDGMMLSGGFYTELPSSVPLDSVRPVFDAAKRDMLTMLKNLK